MKQVYGPLTALIFLFIHLHETQKPAPAPTAPSPDLLAPITQAFQSMAVELAISAFLAGALLLCLTLIFRRWW